MQSFKIFVVAVAQLLSLISVSAEDDTCALAAPDPKKTCISIRLPWNPKPMYFCTDKDKFKYRDQCRNRYSVSNCDGGSIRQDMLMIATPWECCPTTSDPDNCVNEKCPPPPLNRVCHEVDSDPNKQWECCPNYFCEENSSPQMCHFKRLEPTCNSPPPGKKNCIAFVDGFGCCPKFQCADDVNLKPGQCPAEVEAIKHMARYNGTHKNDNALPAPPPPVPAAKMAAEAIPEGGGGGGAAGRVAFMAGAAFDDSYFPFHHHSIDQIACVGDFNCPGNLKCCASEMNVYLQDGRYTFRNKNPAHGYCTEPADKDDKKTKSHAHTGIAFR